MSAKWQSRRRLAERVWRVQFNQVVETNTAAVKLWTVCDHTARPLDLCPAMGRLSVCGRCRPHVSKQALDARCCVVVVVVVVVLKTKVLIASVAWLRHGRSSAGRVSSRDGPRAHGRACHAEAALIVL